MLKCYYCNNNFHPACEQLQGVDTKQILRFYCATCETEHGTATEYHTEQSDDSDLTEYYQIEAIVDHKKDADGYKFRIRWVNYSVGEDTWEPEINLLGSPTLLKRYKQQHKLEHAETSELEEPLGKVISSTNVLVRNATLAERSQSDDSCSHDGGTVSMLDSSEVTSSSSSSTLGTDSLGAPTDMISYDHRSVRICHEVLSLLSDFAKNYSRRNQNERLSVGCYALDSFQTNGITLIPFQNEFFIVLYLSKHDIGFITDVNNSFLKRRSIRRSIQRRLNFRLFCPKFIEQASVEEKYAIAAIIVTLWKDFHRNEVSWPELHITKRTLHQLINLH